MSRWIKQDGQLVRLPGSTRYVSAETPFEAREGDYFIRDGWTLVYNNGSWETAGPMVFPVRAVSEALDGPEVQDSWDVAIPSGVQVGDLLLFFTYHRANLTAPAGLTLEVTASQIVDTIDQRATVHSKVADADDLSSGSFTFTQSDSSARGGTQIVAVRSSIGEAEVEDTDTSTLELVSGSVPVNHPVPGFVLPSSDEDGTRLVLTYITCAYNLAPGTWEWTDQRWDMFSWQPGSGIAGDRIWFGARPLTAGEDSREHRQAGRPLARHDYNSNHGGVGVSVMLKAVPPAE